MNLEKEILNEIYNMPTQQAQLDAYVELNGGLFDDEKNLEIYHLFGDLLTNNKKLDQLTLYEQTQNAELAISFDGADPFAFQTHLALLKEKKYKSQLTDSIEKALNEIKAGQHHDDIEDVKNGLIADLSGLELDTGSSFIDYQEQIAQIETNLNNGRLIEGHSWGLIDLDTITSGIVTPRLIVIGGLKKSGKTRFLIHIRKVLYKQDVPSIFLSLEVPPYEVTKLTYSCFCEIYDTKFRNKGGMTTGERLAYEEWKAKLDFNMIPTECVSSLTVEQVLGRIRRYAKMYPKGVILIDYLQRIKHDINKQAQELEKISNLLADATRNYNISIILLSQLSNKSEGQIPTTGDLKGSGGIGEAADSIILLDNIYRRTRSIPEKGKINLILEQRYNDSGQITVYSDLGKCKFSDLPENIHDGI